AALVARGERYPLVPPLGRQLMRDGIYHENDDDYAERICSLIKSNPKELKADGLKSKSESKPGPQLTLQQQRDARLTAFNKRLKGSQPAKPMEFKGNSTATNLVTSSIPSPEPSPPSALPVPVAPVKTPAESTIDLTRTVDVPAHSL